MEVLPSVSYAESGSLTNCTKPPDLTPFASSNTPTLSCVSLSAFGLVPGESFG